MLLYTLNPDLSFSAPVSGIGSFSYSETGNKNFLSGFQFVLRSDHQKNDFPEQIKQFLYKDPGSEEDFRHYSKTRSSENSCDTTELEAGILFFDNIFFYGKAGFGRFKSDMMILDESISGLYTQPDLVRITDDSMFTFGGGLSFKLFQKEVKSVFRYLNANLDLQYRRLSIDSGNRGVKQISYEADLDEIQASVVLSGTTDNTRFFLGPRVSSITGNEKLCIKQENFLYDEKIKTTKNIGWVFGVSFFNNDKYSVTMQKRTGDEEGVSFEAQINF
jgi:hypothetical protein